MELTADWNLRLNAAVYSGGMSQYRCYFILFQPTLLFPFLVHLGFALVFVSVSYPVYALCVFFSVDVYHQKAAYYGKLWALMNLRLSEIDKTPSEISNMLQGMVANYRIQVS